MALPLITATGNLVFEPDYAITANGTARCRMRLACNERKKVNGEWVDGEPTFIDVIVWRGLADACADLTKGTAVMVTGKLRIRTYDNKEGHKATAVEIEATDISKVIKAAKVAQATETDPWEF